MYDVVVLGAGPGGYVAAIRAGQLGLKVLLVEKSQVGGICLNWGCIPTKSLLKCSDVFRTIKQSQKYGITVNDAKLDISQVIKYSRNVVNKLSSGISMLLQKNNVKVVKGTGTIRDKNTIYVKNDSGIGESYKTKNVVIATGAQPRQLKGLESDRRLIWTYKEAMTPNVLPRSLVIVGGGAIGVEFASFYNTLGCGVTLVEAQDRILPLEDLEISKIAHQSFEKQGIKIYTKSQIEILEKHNEYLVMQIKQSDKVNRLSSEKLMIAAGVIPNVKQIGLENTNVEVKNGYIVTNEFLETYEKGVFAIGDVTNPPWFAHKASHEGIICIDHIAGIKTHTINANNIPSCVYSYPQIASIGFTEEAAIKAGYTIKVGKFPFMANGKAISIGEEEGLVKTIFNAKTGELLGAHMIGDGVTELIHSYALAKTSELTDEEIMQTVFPHPTLSEMIHESSLNSQSKSIHI